MTASAIGTLEAGTVRAAIAASSDEPPRLEQEPRSFVTEAPVLRHLRDYSSALWDGVAATLGTDPGAAAELLEQYLQDLSHFSYQWKVRAGLAPPTAPPWTAAGHHAQVDHVQRGRGQ